MATDLRPRTQPSATAMLVIIEFCGENVVTSTNLVYTIGSDGFSFRAVSRQASKQQTGE